MNSTKVMLQLHRERKKVILDKDVWLKTAERNFGAKNSKKALTFKWVEASTDILMFKREKIGITSRRRKTQRLENEHPMNLVSHPSREL